VIRVRAYEWTGPGDTAV